MRGLDFLVERLEPFELGREAAFRGRVDDEDDFVLEIGQRVGLPFFCMPTGGGHVSMTGVFWLWRLSGGVSCDVLSRGLKS